MIQGESKSSVPRGAASAARVALCAAGLFVAWAANAANCTDAPVSGKTYYIVNKDSGLQLDVAYGRTTAGGDVIQWTPATSANQQWTMTQQGDGSWKLVAKHSGLALDVRNDSATVTQYGWQGSANQRWYVQNNGDAYTIASALSWKLLSAADKSAGSKLAQRYLQQDAPLQRWYFNPVDGQCSGSGKWSSFMGYNRILLGGAIDYHETRWGGDNNVTDTLNKAPWDLRYTYVHSSTTAPSPGCYSQCTANCFGWWGCEGMDREGKYPVQPGHKIKFRNNDNANFFKFRDGSPHKLIEQWTWYAAEDLGKAQGQLNKQLGLSATADADYRGAIKNPRLLKAYLEDYRFFLQSIGQEKNIIEIEPDFWGFIRDTDGPHPNDAHAIKAAVNASGFADCKGYEDSAAGLARCMIQMAKNYATNSTVGMHLSCWDWNAEDSANRGPQACIRYYKSLGADTGHFIVGETNDRDAAWAAQPRNGSKTWYKWDNATFDLWLARMKTFTEGIGVPMIVWQIPLGNETLPNTYGKPDGNGNLTAGKFKDDKVHHLMTNLDRVAASHIVALQFGAGHNEQTSTETDGGYLLRHATDYYNQIKNGSQIGKLR